MTASLFPFQRRSRRAAFSFLRRTLWWTYPWVPLWKIAERLDRRDARRSLDAWFDHVKECDGC